MTRWTGIAGVAILLGTFFLHPENIIQTDSQVCLLMNITGAGIACLASVLLKYLPFLILEGCRTLESGIELINYLKIK